MTFFTELLKKLPTPQEVPSILRKKVSEALAKEKPMVFEALPGAVKRVAEKGAPPAPTLMTATVPEVIKYRFEQEKERKKEADVYRKLYPERYEKIAPAIAFTVLGKTGQEEAIKAGLTEEEVRLFGLPEMVLPIAGIQKVTTEQARRMVAQAVKSKLTRKDLIDITKGTMKDTAKLEAYKTMVGDPVMKKELLAIARNKKVPVTTRVSDYFKNLFKAEPMVKPPAITKELPIKGITKELEPLAKEARKYGSAKEWMKKMTHTDNLIFLQENLNMGRDFTYGGTKPGTTKAEWRENTFKPALTDFYNQAVRGVEKVKPEITPPIKPPVIPPIPPTPPSPQLPQFAGKPREDPIPRLTELIKEAKPLRKEIEKVYTVERAKRIAKVERFIEEKIETVGGEEGYKMVLSKLKGELVSPEAKLKFEPIKEKLTSQQLKDIYLRTWQHPYLDNWEKISAANGLTDLLQGALPQPKQLVLLEEIYGTELIKSILAKRALGVKLGELALEIANLPRAMLATADMSAFLRQGVVMLPARPKISAKAMIETFKFAFSPKAFNQYFKDLPKDPLYALMRKSKLAITDPSRIAGGLAGREEPFISRILQKLPVVGILPRFAERAYVGFLNKIRVDVFKVMVDELLSQGYSFIKNKELFKAAANIVNTFTGRGSLGQLDRVTPALNAIFFSPRLNAARFNALNPIWYARQPKPLRLKAISDFSKFVVTGLTILALMKIWKEVNNIPDSQLSLETDLRSSDAGKIKMGNTRWDIWGGFQQWARVFAQIVTGERKNTTTGEIVSLNEEKYPFTTRKEVLLRFIEGKLAPVPGLVNELMSGAKTFTGEDITPETVIREKFIPMYIQDIADAFADGGLGRAVGVGLTAFFGVGVQTWTSKKSFKIKNYSKPSGRAGGFKVKNYTK